MTPIDRLRELHERATQTPWEVVEDMGSYFEKPSFIVRVNGTITNTDKELIAHMRNLLPDLLELVEACEHAYELGYFGHGSTKGMVIDALSKLRGDN